MTLEPAGDGFFWVSRADALRLCAWHAEGVGPVKGKLPAYGRERLVEHEGRHYWLCRLTFGDRRGWALRDAGNWKLIDGKAVLSSRC